MKMQVRSSLITIFYSLTIVQRGHETFLRYARKAKLDFLKIFAESDLIEFLFTLEKILFIGMGL